MSKNTFYLYNIHRDDFILEPLYFSFIKRRALKKYNYIANLINEENNVKLLFSDKCSGLFPQSFLDKLPQAIRRKLIKWELKKWCRINNLPSDTPINWLDDNLAIRKEDALFMFQLSNIRYIKEATEHLNKFGKIYVHLSHYYLNPKLISTTLQNIENIFFCGDSDVSEHPFFLKYFSWYNKNFFLTPFYIADRFEATKPFEERLNKIISTGTFHPMEDYPNLKFLKEELGVDAFHYNRRNIYEQQLAIKDYITCHNSPWKQKDAAWYKKLWNAQKVSQKAYFSMDIVQEYNKHKFALIGEEIGGFPGIGTFEAMACGCIVIANPNSLVGLSLGNDIFIPTEGSVTEKNDLIKNVITKYCYDKKRSDLSFVYVEQKMRMEVCKEVFRKNFL
jgi:hypothetical protein